MRRGPGGVKHVGVARLIHIFALSSEPMLASEPAFLRCCDCCDCCYSGCCCSCCSCCCCTPCYYHRSTTRRTAESAGRVPRQAGIGAAMIDRDRR